MIAPLAAAAGFWPRAALVAAGLVTTGALASSDDGPVLCPIRRCTGGYCPGCGLTRAAGHLLRGDVRASFDAHPLLLVLIAQFLALIAVRAAAGRRGVAAIEARLPLVAAVNLTLLVGVWAARLATGAIPSPFPG